MSRLINRLYGRVYGWFDTKESRLRGSPAPARFSRRARLMLTDLEDRAVPASFTVTNTSDSGAGSLRQAITDANTAAGADDIVFDASFSSSVKSIGLLTGLPTASGTAGQNLTITGPGPEKLTIFRNTAAAVISPFNLSGPNTFAISGLSITGFSGGGVGGAIRFNTSNTAASSLTLDSMHLFGNTCVGAFAGGGVYMNNGDLTITNSSIHDNSVGTGEGGGGVRVLGTLADNVLTITNTTIAHNTSISHGGGIGLWGWAGTLNLNHTTVASNTAQSTATGAGAGGGGISRFSGVIASFININASIVAGNSAANGRHDIAYTETITTTINDSVIGVDDTFTYSGANNKTGNSGAKLDPMLSALGNYGGLTPSMIPAPTSDAIDRYDPGVAGTDQRGQPRPATDADAGAVERQASEPPTYSAPPLPTVTADNAGTNPFYISIDFFDVNTGTFDSNDVRVTGPNSFNVLATLDSFTGNSTAATAKYKITPPALPTAGWDAGDNGTYTAAFEANQIKSPGGAAISAGPLATFKVAIPATHTVTNTNDSGAGSLREAITNANAIGGTADTILFQAGVTGTINLLTVLPAIADSLTITGPGSSLLTIQRDAGVATAMVMLPIADGTSVATVNVSGISFKGNSSSAITTADEIVTLTDVSITGVSTTSAGAAINVAANGKLTLLNSTINGNTTTGAGAGISATTGASVVIDKSTISNNVATGAGGGINFISSATGQSLIVTNSSIFGNTSKTITANLGGGGISFAGSPSTGGVLIRSSTISGNSAAGSGGGIVFSALNGALNPFVHIQNSTITANTANSATGTFGQGGGGVALASIGATVPTLDIESTILSGNFSPNNGFEDLSVIATAIVEATFSAIGNPNGHALGGASSDNLDPADAVIGALNLAVLGFYNSGTTKSHALNAGSKALEEGSNPSNVTPALTKDQNNNERVQPIGTGIIDIGAVERIVGVPSGSVGTLPAVSKDEPGANNPYTFTISWSDDTLIERDTIGAAPDDVAIVKVGGGFSVNATFVSADSAVDAPTIVATYKFTPPGGMWDSTDNGTYQVNVLVNGVKSTGNVAVPAGTLGTITVNAAAPAAVAATTTVNFDDATTNPYKFTVTYSDANAINVSGIINNNGAVRVTGPGGFDVPATYVSIDDNTNGTPRTATYQILPPGGTWDGPDAGTYSVVMQASQVKNVSPGTFVPAGTIGTFAVDIGTTFFVTNTNDTGAGSLRGAILAANAGPAPDKIVFSTIFDTPQTISLSSGELLISEDLILIGPGAGLLTLTSALPTRAFHVSNAADILEVSISKLRISGLANPLAGSAIQFNNEKLTLDSVVVANNTSTAGGAVSAGAAGSYILVQNSAIVNNKSGIGGGFNIVSLTLGNTFILRNSTVSGNSSSGNGGGIYHSNTGALTNFSIFNSTITNNTSTGGGGIRATASSGAMVTIESSIIADNKGPVGSPDILNFIVNSTKSAIGNASGYTVGSSTDDVAIGANLMLGLLADNGGGTLTQSFDPSSPLRNKGSNPNSEPFDQRGAPFNRESPTTLPDIGSFEFVSGVPFAQPGALPNVTADQPGVNNPYTFTVTYADDTAISRITIGNQPDDDIVVSKTGGGFTTTATFVSADSAVDAPVIVATYKFNPPGGTWDTNDFGSYEVSLPANTVKNTLNVSIPAGKLGAFTVNFPQTFVVTNTNDAGSGSLRQAILDANANAGLLDTIMFESTTFSTPQTILLTGTELAITDPVTILGPSKSLLTVSGNNAHRIFNINNSIAGTTIDVTIQDMALVNASIAGAGGAIIIQDENVTINRVNFTNNKASTSGAAINVTLPADNSLIINDSSFSGGSATTDGGAINIPNPSAGKTMTLRIFNGSFTANTAGDDGGAINLGSTTLTYNVMIESSLFASNVTGKGSTTGDGSALYFRGTVGPEGFIIRNSTVSGNSAGASTTNTTSVGSALAFPLVSGSVLVQNSTIRDNTAVSTSPDAFDGGGGIAISNVAAGAGILTLESSIVAGNVSANGHPDISSESAVNYSFSAIGAQTFIDGTTQSNLAFGIDLKLAPLANNGGQSATYAVLAGSPLINAGIATTTPGFPDLTTDQRGVGFARKVGSEVDIGAYERVPGIPSATTGTLIDVTSDQPGTNNPYTFTVSYSDDALISRATIGNLPNDDITITRVGGGFTVTASFVSADSAVDAPSITATYSFTPPGGSWDGNDNGSYQVNLPANTVKNTANVSVPAGTLGSFAVNAPAPAAAAATSTVTIDDPSTNPYKFTVTYTDANAIDVSSVIGNNNAVRVTGPNGFNVPATYLSIDDNSNGTPRTATYQITPPVNAQAGWDDSDNGSYSVVMQASQVKNLQSTFVTNGAIGSFVAAIGGLLIVSNTGDSGPGSLRDAIAFANSDPAPDTILFSSLFNAPQTITLTGGELLITENVTIDGPGANLLTISGNNASRVFKVANTASVLTVTLQDMKVTGGFAAGGGTTTRGGGIDFTAESVTLDRMWVTGNTSSGVGGGISNTVNGGNLTLLNSTVDNNVAQTGDTTYGGGGILTNLGGAIVIRNSTIAHNTAASANTSVGGGLTVYSATGSVVIENSTFVGNQANTNGGGIRFFSGTYPVTITNTIIAGNSSVSGVQDLIVSGSMAINVINSAVGGSSFTAGPNTANNIGDTGLNLGTLQNNGGPTPTIALGTGSTAIDAGTTSTLNFDQRGAGFPRVVNGNSDIGAFEVQSGAVTVTNYAVNSGAAQRSRVTSITVTFSGSVSPASFSALGAITLTRTAATPTGTIGTVVQTGAAGANGQITVTQPGPSNQLVLTFSNANSANETAGVEYGSLADGRWQLAIPSAGNYQSTLNDVQLRRLFGDFEAGPGSNGTVDAGDFGQFGTTFGTSGAPGFSPFDYDNNGTIDSGDLGAFGARFGFSV